MPWRRWLVVTIAVAAAGWVVGLLVVSGFDQSATPEIEAATATVPQVGSRSTAAAAATSTTDRFPNQDQAPGTTTTKRAGDEAPTQNARVDAPDQPTAPEDTVDPILPPVETSVDWDSEPVAFRVLAVNHLERGYAVVDLANSVMRVYPLGHHNIVYPFMNRNEPVGSLGVAAFTRRGDILLNPAGESQVYVVPDGDFSATPTVLRPSRENEVHYIHSSTQVLGDQSGEKVWFLQRTWRETTLVDLVTTDNTTVMETVTLDGTYYLSGLLGNDLYVVRGGEDRDDLVVSENGVVSEVVSCRDLSTEYGAFSTVGVFGTYTACTSLGGQHLVFYDVMTGQLDTIPAFESGRWGPTVLPEIPAGNTTGVHNDQLLLRLWGSDASIAPLNIIKAVYVADLSEHSVRLVYEHERPGFFTPLGIVDSLLIATAGNEGRSTIVAIDIETGEWQTVVDLPKGYFIYDAK